MTWWFDRSPGSFVSIGKDDPTTLLINNGKPDWVRLPPELGGGKVKVIALIESKCPNPKCEDHLTRHYILKSAYGVAECADNGFLWYEGKPVAWDDGQGDKDVESEDL